jgi:transcriptional regulator with XRE-family HTH domain
MTITDLKDSKLNTPYARLRFIRALSGLTRKEIEAKYDLPEITLRKWETGKLLISKKGAKKCLIIYKNENIIATEEWLYNGTGSHPYLSIEFGNQNDYSDKIVSYFKEIYQNCIVLKINDEAMLPIYKTSELVVGDVYRGNLEKLHNKDCIIILDNDEILLRKFIFINEHSYCLMCTNPSATSEPILNNVNIKFLAPVLWHQVKS